MNSYVFHTAIYKRLQKLKRIINYIFLLTSKKKKSNIYLIFNRAIKIIFNIYFHRK